MRTAVSNREDDNMSQVAPDVIRSPNYPSVLARLAPELRDRLARRVTVAGGSRTMSPVHAPWTGEVLCELPLCTTADVEEAVRRAREAQRSWARLSFGLRARVFRRLHDLALQRQDEILDIIQLETGKARRHALEEALDTPNICRHYIYHGGRELKPKRRRGALPLLTATWEYRHPLGVIGFIAPWNYPLSLSLTDAIPALLAGNGVVLKPDQQTPLTALWAVDLLYEAGLPPELFQVVTGRGREIGSTIIESTDFICFTGSTATGRVVAEQAGKGLIGCSLELGGKNPMLVLDDASLEDAAIGAVRGCFANSGQLCISIERLLVHRKIFDDFVARFVTKVKSMTLASGFDSEIDMGSLASASQLQKVQEHVQDAVEKGAKVLAGGQARPDLGPFFFEPTVLAEVTEEMEVARDETFGPVVSIYRFDSVDEAIDKANDTIYGLNASIWTRNHRRGRALAERVRAGTVNVNEAYGATWGSSDAPMGGFKDSGLGRRHGRVGITKYTELQTVAVQRLLPIAPPRGITVARYGRVMSILLWLMRRIPGIR